MHRLHRLLQMMPLPNFCLYLEIKSVLNLVNLLLKSLHRYCNLQVLNQLIVQLLRPSQLVMELPRH